MKSNGLLKWLTLPLVLLVVWIAIKVFSSSHETATASSARDTNPNKLTAEEIKALGVEGDTPQDTIATLVGQVKQLRGELKGAVEENKQRKGENERLRLRDAAIDQRIQTAIAAERERWQQDREQSLHTQEQTQGLLQELQHRLDTFDHKTDPSDLPVGLGLREGDAPAGSDRRSADTVRVHWIEPLDARPAEGKKSSPQGQQSDTAFPTVFAPAPDRTPDAIDTSAPTSDTHRSVLSAAEPIYTVPADATLMGSIAMTALIGRVPIDGVVADPYPFKVVIGPDNLTANGIELPELAGAVASGTASGDWTLSCVRGEIRSLTFVFQDGTIRTLRSSSHDKDAGAGSTRSGLGWISDPQGVPCVSGKRLSNAQQYLTSQMLITAAGAGAASLIDSKSGNYSFINGNGTALGTVGISSNEAMDRILAGGVQEMSQWANKLYGQAFAAIYVSPAAKIAVHLEQPLEIDYDESGRKVNHRTEATHEAKLD